MSSSQVSTGSSLRNKRSVALLLSGVTLLLAYLLALRALDTGSLQQYGLVFVLIVLAINRLAVAVRRKAKRT